MATVDLVLLDCSSIQRYVFGSNKLKLNIGASYIVERIYDDWIPETLKELFAGKEPMEYAAWKERPGILRMSADANQKWETGYVGGGNALMIFRHDEQTNWAKEFVKIWSRLLIQHAPGLHPAVAIKETPITLQGDILGADLDKIFEELAINKSKFQPQTTFDRHGITAECKFTGHSAEVYHKDENDENGGWVSSIAKSKFEIVKQANENLAERYKEILKVNKYEFSNDTENLGCIEGESSLIALVHIDGNSIGDKFQKCSGLIERRELSLEVESATHNAMEKTLSLLVSKMPELENHEQEKNGRSFFQWKKEKSAKNYLPIRPIILNGDDITFICDARMSFFLAEAFMHAFAAEPIKLEKLDGTPVKIKLSSCAGIAIVKSKYPFYRAYRLAEELCSSAKKKGRKDGGSSWIDFHVALNGISGELSDIRKSYDLGICSLLWRPWKIDDPGVPQSFCHFKSALEKFHAWPKNKLHELSQALEQGPVETESLLIRFDARGDLELPGLPTVEQAVRKSGWAVLDRQATPYFDVLEAMDFYPEILLKSEGEK